MSSEMDGLSESDPQDAVPWEPALGFAVGGLALVGVSVTAVLAGLVGGAIGGVGVAVGTAGLIGATYFLIRALRAHFEVVREELLDAIAEVDGGGGGDPLASREELEGQLREQQGLIEELLRDLPDQQERMAELADELSRRNRIVQAVLEEQGERTGDSGRGEEPDSEPSEA